MTFIICLPEHVFFSAASSLRPCFIFGIGDVL